MQPPQLTLALDQGTFCADCILRDACADRDGPRACQPLYGEPRYGGVNVVHPARPDFAAYFEEIGGPGFERIRARPTGRPTLGLTLPRVYPRREFDGHLRGRFYAIGADEAIISRRQVLGADELREIVGLWSDQYLALILYGKDLHLERIWPRRHTIVEEIAESGYDFVSPPSYSALINHPPSECIRNMKRSLVFFELLQAVGVTTAPRLAWLSEHDVRRAVLWLEENPTVTLVTLDLAIKDRAEWRRQLSLLRLFDRLTGARFEFLIHGPEAQGRLIELFSFLDRRLHLSGSRAISRPRSSPLDYVRFTEEEEAFARAAQLTARADPLEPPDTPTISRSPNRVSVQTRERLAA